MAYRFNLCANVRIYLNTSNLSSETLVEMFHRFFYMAAEKLKLEDIELEQECDQVFTDFIPEKNALLIQARELQLTPKVTRKILALMHRYYFYEIDLHYGCNSWTYYVEELE